MENSPSRVLLIDTAWLGDVIFTTSLIGTVKTLWPESEVHVLVAPRGKPILLGHPQISKLWILDKRGAHRGLAGTLKIARALGQISFDLILNAHPSFRSRVLTRLIGAPVRVGYKGFGARWCFTHIVPNDLAVEPDHVQRRLNLLAPIVANYARRGDSPESPVLPPARRGDSPESPVRSASDSNFEFRISNFPPAPLFVPINPEHEEIIERTLAFRKKTTGPLLGIVPGSAWETKCWPLENYLALARRWIEERDGFVIAIGAGIETTLLEALGKLDPARAHIVWNEPLLFVAAWLRRCDVVVGNDTGVTLLAVAAQCPRVHVLYGCTQINYAFTPPHTPIHAAVPCCLPRTGHGAHICQWTGTATPWCLSQLSVDRVWSAIS